MFSRDQPPGLISLPYALREEKNAHRNSHHDEKGTYHERPVGPGEQAGREVVVVTITEHEHVV
jgi:hypothetical protein